MRQRHTPVFYKKDSKGKLRVWSQSVLKDDKECKLVTTSGLVNGSKSKRAKLVEDSTREKDFDRAVKLMNNNVDKKLREGYHRSEEEALNAGRLLRPEKAETFNEDEYDKFKLVPGKVFVQPKINGLKCLAEWKDDKLYTKSGLTYHIPEVHKLAMRVSEALNAPVDGEAFIPGLPVGDILSAAKTLDNPNRHRFEYHIYDYVSDEPYSVRQEKLKEVLKGFTGPVIKSVKTFRISNMDIMTDLRRYYDQFLYEGWEGLMIRRGDSPYSCGKRTKNLLKWKPTITKEYPVWHVTYENRYVESIGSMVKLVEFHCMTDHGSVKVVPAWSVEERWQWYLDHKDIPLDEVISKLPPLQIEFREWTKNNLPFHPVGLYFRDMSY